MWAILGDNGDSGQEQIIGQDLIGCLGRVHTVKEDILGGVAAGAWTVLVAKDGGLHSSCPAASSSGLRETIGCWILDDIKETGVNVKVGNLEPW